MKYLLVSCFIFLFFSADAQRSLNVMTYNIRLDVASDSMNNWQYRKENLASTVKFFDVDVLGLQEALERQMADLEQLLPNYKHVGVARDTSAWGEYSAIFYNPARLTAIEESTFWLSEDIYKEGKKGWDAALPRIVTWAKFKDNVTKKVFYFFNTHFDHKGRVARRESAKLLLKQVKEIAGAFPVIVTGDFNAAPDDEPVQIILDQANPLHLTNSITKTESRHYGPTGTFSGFKNAERNDNPIDYIFVKNGIRVLKHATLSQTWNGRFASDHFPVFAEVEL